METHSVQESTLLIPSSERCNANLEDGALLPGGAISLDSTAAMGIFAQYAAVGFLFTLLPGLTYPIFNVYLQMEGYQTTSYAVLVTMGWSFKVVFGILSDCVPVFGYRRKSWMLVGWSICLVCLTIMASMSFGAPYCDRSKSTMCRTPFDKVAASERRYFNLHAPDQGSLFIVLSIFVSLGYVMADCAADALVVKFAQREPLTQRGKIQTTTYVARYVAGIPASFVTAVGLNGVQYNGSYSFSLAPNIPYAICTVPVTMAGVAVVCWIQEDRADDRKCVNGSAWPTFQSWSQSSWKLLQRQVMWQICFVKVSNGLLRSIAATPTNPIKSHWANVSPAIDSISAMTGSALFSAALYVVSRFGLDWDWRWSLATANLSILVLDAAVMLPTTWNIVRNPYFYALVTMTEQMPNGMAMIIGNLCVAELADVGNEGAASGLLTSLSNLSYPMAAVVYKYVDSFFHVSQADILLDTEAVRWDVTAVYLFSYGCKLLALVPLVWLPAQKVHIQELKQTGVTSALAGGMVLVVCGGGLVFSVMSNCLAIMPSTKCFRLAGGNGVVNADGWCPTG